MKIFLGGGNSVSQYAATDSLDRWLQLLFQLLQNISRFNGGTWRQTFANIYLVTVEMFMAKKALELSNAWADKHHA